MDNSPLTKQQRRRPRFLSQEEEEFLNLLDEALPYKPVSDAELLDVFPEGKKIILKMIRDAKREIERVNTENLPKFDAALESIYTHETDPDKIEIAKMLAHFWYLELPLTVRLETKRPYKESFEPGVGVLPAGFFTKVTITSLPEQIKHWEKILKLHSIRHAVTHSPDEVNEVTIMSAKAVPLEDLIGEKPNYGGFIRCPFHNEKTPSCKIDRKKNRFHCFGCGADGDVIDWTMKVSGKDFLSAVRELTRSR